MSKEFSHVPFGELADLLEGHLGTGEQARVRNHLAVCSRCAANLAWLEHITGLMRADDSKDAPPEVVARAVRLFRPPVPAVAPGPIERLRAILRFDSAQLPLAYGMRTTGPATHQLLYAAGDHELDLRLTQVGNRWAVAGQVLGPDGAGQVALQGPRGPVEGAVNALGEFTLPPVEPGNYVLRLRLADLEIGVHDLHVGA